MDLPIVTARRLVRGIISMALASAWLATAAPAHALVTLQPVNVSTGGARLSISAPLRPSGRMSELSLRADARAGSFTRVVFDISRRTGRNFDISLYTQEIKREPFCLFDAAPTGCTAKKIGERFPNSQEKVVPGAYRAQVTGFDASNSELWRGDVYFVVAAAGVSLGLPPNGTYDGTGILVDWRDSAYSPAGVDRLNMEVRATTKEAGANGTGIGYAEFTLFKIGATTEDRTEVFRRHELTLPYCLFGEEADGKTCRTIRRGAQFPTSSKLIFEGDQVKGKQDDTSLPRLRLEPGEYKSALGSHQKM